MYRGSTYLTRMIIENTTPTIHTSNIELHSYFINVRTCSILKLTKLKGLYDPDWYWWRPLYNCVYCVQFVAADLLFSFWFHRLLLIFMDTLCFVYYPMQFYSNLFDGRAIFGYFKCVSYPQRERYIEIGLFDETVFRFY